MLLFLPKTVFLLLSLIITYSAQAQISETDSSSHSFEPNLEQKFFRANNGVTIICSSAEFNESGEIDGVIYTKRNKQDITIENAETTCTSGVYDLSYVFYSQSNFNQDISHWDVSSVYDMSYMFFDAQAFNQDLSNWCVSNLATTPVNFAEGSGLSDQFIPIWGSCPINAGTNNED